MEKWGVTVLLINYLQVTDIVQFVVCLHVLKVSLVRSLLETQSGDFTTPHAGVRVAAATSMRIENLTPPLNQVTHVSQRVEQRGRPVAYILIVELEPPIARLVILFSNIRLLKLSQVPTPTFLVLIAWYSRRTGLFRNLFLLTLKGLMNQALCKMYSMTLFPRVSWEFLQQIFAQSKDQIYAVQNTKILRFSCNKFRGQHSKVH